MIYVWMTLISYMCIGAGVAIGVLTCDYPSRKKPFRLLSWCVFFWPLTWIARDAEEGKDW